MVEVPLPQGAAHLLEAAPLRLHEGRVLPGGGEVGVDALHPHPQGLHRPQGRSRLLPGKAHPVHARVHLEVGPGHKAQGAGPLGKGLRRLQGGEGGHEAKLQGLLRLQGVEASEKEDLPLDAPFPEAPPLLQGGHGEAPHALSLQEAGEGKGPVAVGVRLEHGDHLPSRPPGEKPVVRPKGGEVHLHPGPLFHLNEPYRASRHRSPNRAGRSSCGGHGPPLPLGDAPEATLRGSEPGVWGAVRPG